MNQNLTSTKVIHVNQKFTLNFPLQQGTGYTYWISTIDPYLSVINQRTVQQNQKNNIIGSQSLMQFTLQAHRTGFTDVIVTYGRPWDSTTWKQQILNFNIIE